MNALKTMPTVNKRTVTQFELTKNIVTNLKQFELTPTAKLVLILLTTHFNPDNGAVVFPSMPFISETLGIGLTATKQAIKDLIIQGLIIKAKRNKISGNHNKYLLTLKVQNLTSERSENEPFKSSKSDLFMITNNNEQRKEQVLQQHSEVNDLAKWKKKLNTTLSVSIEDFEKLKKYAASKGANNTIAYAKALINNGSYKEILDDLNKQEKNNIPFEQRVIESRNRIYGYKLDNVEPIPEEIKRKADELIKRLKMKG